LFSHFSILPYSFRHPLQYPTDSIKQQDIKTTSIQGHQVHIYMLGV